MERKNLGRWGGVGWGIRSECLHKKGQKGWEERDIQLNEKSKKAAREAELWEERKRLNDTWS